MRFHYEPYIELASNISRFLYRITELLCMYILRYKFTRVSRII